MSPIDALAVDFDYETAASEYYATLPMEHFMESVIHSSQKQITLCSLKLVKMVRPDVHFFSELLIQYFHEGQLRRVVPDSMVVVCAKTPKPSGSYNVPREPTGPFLVIEYVSSEYHVKDYETNFRKYKDELFVPYYLLFNCITLRLDLYHLEGSVYIPIEPDANGRRAMPELDLEISQIDGWVRFWHLGELLALPDELKELVNLKDRQLKAKDRSIVKKNQVIAEKEQVIAEKDQVISKKDQVIAEKDQVIEQLLARLAQHEKPG